MIISFLRLLFSKTFFFGFVFCFKWSYDPRSYGCNCSNNCIEKPEKVKATMWVWIYDLVMVVGHSNQLSQQIVGGGHLWVQNNVPMMNESMYEMIYRYIKWITIIIELHMWNQVKLWSLLIWMHWFISYTSTGLQITAGQRTMSGQK